MADCIPNFFFGIVNTISIPIDAIFPLLTLIIFSLIIYFFDSISVKPDDAYLPSIDCDLELAESVGKIENEFILEPVKPSARISNQFTRVRQTLSYNSKFFEVGALVFLALGGTGLFIFETSKNSLEDKMPSKVKKTNNSFERIDSFYLSRSDSSYIRKKGLEHAYLFNCSTKNPSNNHFYFNDKRFVF